MESDSNINKLKDGSDVQFESLGATQAVLESEVNIDDALENAIDKFKSKSNSRPLETSSISTRIIHAKKLYRHQSKISVERQPEDAVSHELFSRTSIKRRPFHMDSIDSSKSSDLQETNYPFPTENTKNDVQPVKNEETAEAMAAKLQSAASGEVLSNKTIDNILRKRAPEASVKISLQEDLLQSLDKSFEEVRVLLMQQNSWLNWQRLFRKAVILDLKQYRRTRKQLYSSLREHSYIGRWFAQKGIRTEWDALLSFCAYQINDGALHVMLMIISLCVDLCFSILYLVEMQIVYPRYNLGKGYPHWLFVSRPLPIWYVAVSFSIFDAISVCAYIVRWPRKLHQILADPFFIFNVVTAGPFLASIFFNLGNDLYVPYYLRLWVVLLRLRGVLRLHKGHTRIVNDFQERTIILVLTLINILFTALCAFQYFEMMTPPAKSLPLKYSVIESFYFIIITISTVGYGDITPSSYPSQIVVIVLIIVALAVLPGLIANLVDAARTSGGSYTAPYYHDSKFEFVVVQGYFRTPELVSDILHVFFGSRYSRDGLGLLILSPEKLPNKVRGLINSSAYDNRVQFRIGSLLEERDLKKYRIGQSSAIFLSGHDLNAPSAAAADQQKVLSVWSLTEFAPHVPIYAETLLPQTESYCDKYTTAIACLDDLRQLLLGYSCLYRGTSTLILNLLSQVMPQRKFLLAWEAQYADGLNQQIVSGALNPVFARFHFSKLSKFLYEYYQVILFAVHIYNAQTFERILVLNPGREYRMDVNDVCIYIAPSANDVAQINSLTEEQLKNLLSAGRNNLNLSSSYYDANDSFVSTAKSSSSGIWESPNNSFGDIGNFFADIGEETSIQTPNFAYPFSIDLPLCHLLKVPHTSLEQCAITTAVHMKQHILIVARDFQLARLLCTLRTAQLNINDFRPVVIFCHRYPTENEFKTFAEFPKVFFIKGDCLTSKDLIRAGAKTAEKILLTLGNRSALRDANSGTTDDLNATVSPSLSDYSSSGDWFQTWAQDHNDSGQDARIIILSAMIHDMFGTDFQSKTVIVEIAKRSYIRFIAPTLSSSYSKSQKLAIAAIKSKVFGVEAMDLNNTLKSTASAIDSYSDVEFSQLNGLHRYDTFFGNKESDTKPRKQIINKSVSTRDYLSAKRDIALYGLTQPDDRFDYLFAPTYAAGRILLERPLKTILMETFMNSVTLDTVKVLCGVRYKESVEMYQKLQILPSFLCYIDVPVTCENKPFGMLYSELATKYGIVALGLYRAGGNCTLGNSLPFVYTNPLASTIVRPDDLVYVLKSGND